MSLSNTLFKTVTQKLKLAVCLLNEEKLYVKNIKTKINYLKEIKENNYKNLSLLSTCNRNDQNLIIMYIINISFLKTNTLIHVSDIKGSLKLFYSAGSAGLTGKQKLKRRIALSKIISMMIKKATYLNGKPVALHLNNVNYYKNLIISKLKHQLYVRVIKSFNQTPHNGCRNKKLRRKKYNKKFK